MAGSIFADAVKPRITDGSRTLDVDDVHAVDTNSTMPSDSDATMFNKILSGPSVACLDTLLQHSSGPMVKEESAELLWLADGTFNGRAHCNIFVNSADLGSPLQEDHEKKVKELKGRLTNTVTAQAVLNSDDDIFADDIGKQVAQQTYITLLIGDWVGALECLLAMKNLDPEDVASALEYKDEDGNTLMHRAVMSKDSPDFIQEVEERQKCRGLKFEDNSDQLHREKIIERLFLFDKSLLIAQNNKGETPLDCCESNIMREHIRMLVRKRLVEKKSSNAGTYTSRPGMLMSTCIRAWYQLNLIGT